MAKIVVKDQAVVIESTLTNSQLTRAEKYFPEVLVLSRKDEEENKTVPYFAIGTTNASEGSVAKSGIEFVVGEKEDNAQVTITIGKMSKGKKTEYVKDNFGPILRNLQLIEKAYAEVASKFDKEYAELDKNIVID